MIPQFRSLFRTLDQSKFNQEGSFWYKKFMIRIIRLTIYGHNILQEAHRGLRRRVQRSPERSLICYGAGERVGTCKEIWNLGMSSFENFDVMGDDCGRFLTFYGGEPEVGKKNWRWNRKAWEYTWTYSYLCVCLSLLLKQRWYF